MIFLEKWLARVARDAVDCEGTTVGLLVELGPVLLAFTVIAALAWMARSAVVGGGIGMSAKQKEAERGGAPWVSLDRAAAHLGLNAAQLRKTLERRATRAGDGATEAMVDGVRARKFGRLWRVRFSEAWGAP